MDNIVFFLVRISQYVGQGLNLKPVCWAKWIFRAFAKILLVQNTILSKTTSGCHRAIVVLKRGAKIQ